METGLHIGGGLPDPRTDSSVLRTIDGKPFIPGSSFKGAFRCAVERIVPHMDKIKTCGFALESEYHCVTVNEDLKKEYAELKETKKCYVITQKILDNLSEDIDSNFFIGKIFSKSRLEQILKNLKIEIDKINLILDKCKLDWNNATNLKYLDDNLCHTCKFFGSPYTAGRVFFSDLYLTDEISWIDKTEVRDGVVIDRDSERAVPHLKYDYEVVPAGISFDFSITMENVSDYELGLVATGIQEFKNGMIPLGGIKSRGLGRCVLKDLNIKYIEFNSKESLKDYLLKGKDGMKKLEDDERFFSDKIAHLFSEDVNYIC